MNESVIWSSGCRWPPTLKCTVPQAAGPCATANGGPPALARNVSRNPAAEGRRARGARSDRGRLEAVDQRRELPDDRQVGDRDRRERTPGVRVQAGSRVIVTTRAAVGTHWASTRIAVYPSPTIGSRGTS